MNNIIHVSTEEHYAAASKLFQEYAEWLGIDLEFQNFKEELLHLKNMYALPLGGIVLYKQDHFVGCIAFRKWSREKAELKRMYVKPEFQGKGVGSALLHEALDFAKKLGYKSVLLDTLDDMLPAISLYKKNGFIEIPAYYHNPNNNAVFFEKTFNPL